MSVVVVTDSTAYLPEGLAAASGVVVVPLHVIIGAHSRCEGLDISPAEVATALAGRGVKVSTSMPTPAELTVAYRACGAERIVSVHLSGDLSGTVGAARLAAEEVAAEGIEVRVVDSRSIVMGLGFAVLRAAEAAARGDDLDAVAQAAQHGSTTLFYVDTLEYLRRGGRIGTAAALVGAALMVKPLLQMSDGRIAPLEKVRTASKAIARLEELAVQAAGDAAVDLAVHHLAAGEKAARLADRLRERVPGLGSLHLTEVGAVVGAHVGPGLLGVVVSHR